MYIHTHTNTHKCMYTLTTYHTSHTCAHSVTYTNAGTHTYISHIAQMYTHPHTLTCIAHSHTNTLTPTNTCMLTRVHSRCCPPPCVQWGSMLGCCRRAARRPGLWVPTGLGQPPASASLLPHHLGPRPGLWATGGLCVWPHGRLPGLRCPGPSNRPAPSASSSWPVAPSVTLPAVGDRSLLMPSRRARGDRGAGLTGAC